MTIITFNKAKTIVKTFDSSSGQAILPVFSNTLINPPIGQVLSVNAFIKNLKAYSVISSLAPIKQPNFTLEDSETDKLYKTLDIEWGSARKQLNLYLSEGETSWYQVGAISLLNPSGYPYRVYNLMDLFTDNLAIELGENGIIGAQIIDVGYGILTGTDKLTIHGNYIQEIVIEQPTIPNVINVSPVIKIITLTTPTTPITPTDTEQDDFMALTSLTFSQKFITFPLESGIAIPANPNRKYLSIENVTDTTATIFIKDCPDFTFTLYQYNRLELVTRGGLYYTGAFETESGGGAVIRMVEGV